MASTSPSRTTSQQEENINNQNQQNQQQQQQQQNNSQDLEDEELCFGHEDEDEDHLPLIVEGESTASNNNSQVSNNTSPRNSDSAVPTSDSLLPPSSAVSASVDQNDFNEPNNSSLHSLNSNNNTSASFNVSGASLQTQPPTGRHSTERKDGNSKESSASTTAADDNNNNKQNVNNNAPVVVAQQQQQQHQGRANNKAIALPPAGCQYLAGDGSIAPASSLIPRYHGTKENNSKPCELWKNNKCPFGSICDFRHSGTGGNLPGAPDDLIGEVFDRNRHCRNFLLNGKCPLHTSCRFEHRDARDLHESAIQQRLDKDPKRYYMLYRGTDVVDSKGKRVCKDWRQYRCRFGSVCEWSHTDYPGASTVGAPDYLCAEVFDPKAHCFDFLVKGKCSRRAGDCKFDHYSVQDLRTMARRRRKEKGLPTSDHDHDEEENKNENNNNQSNNNSNNQDSASHNNNNQQQETSSSNPLINKKLSPADIALYHEKWVDPELETEKRARGATVCAMWMLGRCTYGTICGSLHPPEEIERCGAGCIRQAPDKLLGRGYNIAKIRDGRRICKQFLVDQPCPKSHVNKKGVCDFEHISKDTLVNVALRDEERKRNRERGIIRSSRSRSPRGGDRYQRDDPRDYRRREDSRDRRRDDSRDRYYYSNDRRRDDSRDRISGRRRSRSRSNPRNNSQQQQFYAPPSGFYPPPAATASGAPPPQQQQSYPPPAAAGYPPVPPPHHQGYPPYPGYGYPAPHHHHYPAGQPPPQQQGYPPHHHPYYPTAAPYPPAAAPYGYPPHHPYPYPPQHHHQQQPSVHIQRAVGADCVKFPPPCKVDTRTGSIIMRPSSSNPLLYPPPFGVVPVGPPAPPQQHLPPPPPPPQQQQQQQQNNNSSNNNNNNNNVAPPSSSNNNNNSSNNNNNNNNQGGEFFNRL